VDGVRHKVDPVGGIAGLGPFCASDRRETPRLVLSTVHSSDREENGGLGPIWLGERQLAISNGTSVVLRIHGTILQTQRYKLLSGSVLSTAASGWFDLRRRRCGADGPRSSIKPPCRGRTNFRAKPDATTRRKRHRPSEAQETPLAIGPKRTPHRRPSCPERGRRSLIRQ
jgi:hypothetical protein